MPTLEDGTSETMGFAKRRLEGLVHKNAQSLEEENVPHSTFENPEAARRRVAQARALREQAKRGGLSFEAFLQA